MGSAGRCGVRLTAVMPQSAKPESNPRSAPGPASSEERVKQQIVMWRNSTRMLKEGSVKLPANKQEQRDGNKQQGDS
jgi:hypothetical protein